MRSGFVAVVGKPNVGKSTLVNALVGTPVSITSNKPQTTRRRILGVVNGPDSQIVLVDTPGLTQPRNALGRTMNRVIEAERSEADLVLFVVELTHRPTEEDRRVAASLVGGPPCLLVANKLDLAPRPQEAVPLLAAYSELGEFAEVFPVSASQGSQLEELKRAILERLPEGPAYFPEGMISDLDEQTLIEELVREQVLLHTRQEVPHSVAVKVEDMGPGENPEVLVVRVHLYVEKPTQKRILVGKKGELLRTIGTEARRQLEERLGRRLYLDLWVKVKEDWREREDWLRALGYESQ